MSAQMLDRFTGVETGSLNQKALEENLRTGGINSNCLYSPPLRHDSVFPYPSIAHTAVGSPFLIVSRLGNPCSMVPSYQLPDSAATPPASTNSPSQGQESQSSEPSIKLLPFSPSDSLEAATIYDRAFANDGIRLACFPPRFTSSSNPSEELHWRAARYVAAASLGAVRSVKAIDEKAGGRIVGAAGYLEPGEFQCVDTEMSGERKCKDMPSCCDEDALDEVRRVLRSKREGVLRGDWNVWELSQVFVDPSYQRQGVGRKLLEWGIKQADQDGVPMYLEATPPGKVMYERLGFEVLDVAEFPGIVQDGWPYKMYFMLRNPNQMAGESGEAA